MSNALDDVQEKLIHHLENFVRLSDEAISLLPPNNKTAIESWKADLTRKIDDVKHLQIRMTIVAPMKTGKSTIINAIIGDEILPIHDEAMTALPTEIVLQYNNEQHVVDEPCLLLTETCREILKQIQELIYTALTPKYFSNLDKNLNFNSHLIRVAQMIYKRKDVTDWSAEKTKGSESINKLLHYINDLVHIFTFLYPSNTNDSNDQSPSRLLSEFSQNIPRVQIPKKVSETSTLPIDSKPYRLLLVDTPGPNEEMTSGRLKEIIKEEIKKADIVLVALDYTALGTEIDGQIAETVRKVRDMKDPSYVYAVVNKVDQRQENGKSAEDVRKHIATKYEINEENVFELKARYGLIARKFLAAHTSSLTDEELSRIRQSPVARNVLRQFSPIDFEKKMDKIAPDELHKLAEQLYNISGIPELLNSAIACIRGQIIRRCIESAFRIGYKICHDLQLNIRLHRQNLNCSLEDLQKELDDLQNDEKTVCKIKENFKKEIETKKVLSKLDGELQDIFTERRGVILANMQAFFSENNKQWLDPTKWRSYFYKNWPLVRALSVVGTAAGSLLAFIATSTGIGIVIGGVIFTGVYFNSSGVIEFENDDDARKFIDCVINKANDTSAESYQMVSTKANTACNDALQNIQRVCSKQINEIIEKIRQRFDRNLEFPQCNMPVFNVNLQYITWDSIKIRRRYRPLFGLSPFTLSCELDTNEHKRCHIPREKLKNVCEESVTDNMETISNKIKEEVGKMMERIVTEQVKAFHSFLHQCEEDINNYMSDKERSKEDIEGREKKLDSFKEKFDAEKKMFEECFTRFQQTII
jgi:GTPase Era involved in 16S rRNA processing